jgi:hypothetical protein
MRSGITAFHQYRIISTNVDFNKIDEETRGLKGNEWDRELLLLGIQLPYALLFAGYSKLKSKVQLTYFPSSFLVLKIKAPPYYSLQEKLTRRANLSL